MNSLIEPLPLRRLLSVNPTAIEQEMFELLNAMRMNPAEQLWMMIDSLAPLHSPDSYIQNALEFFNVSGSALQTEWAELVGTAPLAWNEQLTTAARGHSQQMIDNDQQGHQMPGELALSGRVEAAGYTDWSDLAENVYAYAKSALHGHAGFAIDWGSDTDGDGMQDPAGHRTTMMSSEYREVGIGILEEMDPATDVGPLVVTQNFGNRNNIGGSWLVGVVYQDSNGNGRYTAGEGLGGVNVSIKGENGEVATTSMSAGGYQALLSPGAYTVTFSGGALQSATTYSIAVGSENVKLDHWTGAAGPMLIGGTAGNDVIRVSRAGALIRVETNGEIRSYSALGVTQVNVEALDGDDLVEIGEGVGGASVVGGGGSDTIVAADGADSLNGGNGNDVIFGGAGADRIYGNFGDDQLTGGGGDDTLFAGIGNDVLYGGRGSDSIFGGDGTDMIRAGAGDDYLEGKGKADTIHGGEGNDTLLGQAGDDQMFGHGGADVIWANDSLAFADTINGGDGLDRYRADANDLLESVELAI